MSWDSAQKKYYNEVLPDQKARQAAIDRERQEAEEAIFRRQEAQKEAQRARSRAFYAELYRKKVGQNLFKDICDAIENDEGARNIVAARIASGDLHIAKSNPFPQGGWGSWIKHPSYTYESETGVEFEYRAEHIAASLDHDPPKKCTYNIQHPDCAGWQVYIEWCSSFLLFWRPYLYIGIRKI